MMQLALAPVSYYWPRTALLAFYADVAASPVDIVYLGEIVCSRRHEMRDADWLDVARMLRDAGKEVVLSTQVLLESGSDVAAMHRVAANGEFMVEANDLGAVRRLAGRLPFVAGPHLNIYNAETLDWIAGLGASRWVAPFDMDQRMFAALQQERPAGVRTEVFAFGRLPLAYSARCFTARHHNLPKDDCGFRCIEDPDGLVLRTREGEPFLVLNGIQTQSARVHSLLREHEELASLGVDVLRLSPMSTAMPEVIRLFDEVRRGKLAPAQAHSQLCALPGMSECNGYWHGHPGLEQVEGR